LSVLADAFPAFPIFDLKRSSFAVHNRTDLLSVQNSDRGVKSVDASPRVDYSGGSNRPSNAEEVPS